MNSRAIPPYPNWSRRQVVTGALCLCCQPTSSRANSFTIEEIASSVFMRRGIDEDASAGNLDAIANIGFIVGEDAVLVTDSGGSISDGQWLRKVIKEKTQKPIKYVVMSHIHPDHVFGAGAFADDHPAFIGHMKLSEAIEVRGAFYRNNLVEIIGERNVGPIVKPTQIVTYADQIDLGGRIIMLKAHAPAHTTSDLSMMDIESGLLFPADLLFVKRVPSLDGSLLGWLKVLDAFKSTGCLKAVPGHGPLVVDAVSAFDALIHYLMVLREGVGNEIDRNGSIEHAVATIGQSERENWKLFDDYNKRNVIQAYKELEWQ